MSMEPGPCACGFARKRPSTSWPPLTGGIRAQLAFVTAMALFALPVRGAPPAAPSPPSRVERAMSAAERRTTASRFLAERTLSRADFVRALSGLDPDLAVIASEPAFHAYGRAIGGANERILAALYRQEGDLILLTEVSSADLLRLAKETSDAYAAATEAAVAELGKSGAVAGRSASDIEADLLCRIVAKLHRSADGQRFDALSEFELARATDRGIMAAADSAAAQPGAKDSLDEAVAVFRSRGAQLGREAVAGVGMAAALTRVLWGGQESTREFEAAREAVRVRPAPWRKANEDLVDAVERFLLAGGDARAAARWRRRTLAAMERSAIVVDSWGDAVAEAAGLFGVSAEERVAIRAALDEGVVAQVERMKATLAAHARWRKELEQTGASPFNAAPSDALLAAHRRQMATEREIRDRVLGVIVSPLLREELEKMRSPEELEMAPMWVSRMHEQAAKGDDVATEAGGGDAEAQR